MQNLKFKLQKLISISLITLMSIFFVPSAFAHVVVRPAEVGLGVRTNFTVSVPTEADVPTTQVRLIIPEVIKSVRPNVMPGWNIQLVRTGQGDSERVSEIIWSGGNIPVDQRAEFVFSAQAPTTEGSINWKAYQTYANGTVVSWDTDPKEVAAYASANPVAEGMHGEDEPKPFSITKVVNDLGENNSAANNSVKQTIGNDSSLPLWLSVAAILLGGTALFLQIRFKR